MDKEARGGGGGALEEGEKSVETHQRVESGHRDGERGKEGLEGRGAGGGEGKEISRDKAGTERTQSRGGGGGGGERRQRSWQRQRLQRTEGGRRQRSW